ncbi:MAG: FCD domain-containing protein [Chloroflexota bacterium]|nr:FCD domain-containing protein [Chloroflexota bacterium]
MVDSRIDSEFLTYLFEQKCKPGDRLPPLAELSNETGVSVGKLREQMEVARMLGLIEASPRRGITRTAYDFSPPVRLSLLAALAIDRRYFDAFSSLRAHLEFAYWDEAVALLTPVDTERLQLLVRVALEKLSEKRVQIPYQEHRELHLTIFRRLNNPFVLGLLEAYWDAYEAVELNTYADYNYLQKVWQYHARIVEAIVDGDYAQGKDLLVEHMGLLSNRGISMETRANPIASGIST